MFFPLPFWIRVGDLACAPSRRKRAPLPPLSEEESVRLIGQELCRPFVPNPPALEAYRAASNLAESIGANEPGADQLIKLTNQTLQKPNKEVQRQTELILSRHPHLFASVSAILEPEWQYPVRIEEEMEFPELVNLKRVCLLIQLQAATHWMNSDKLATLENLRLARQLADRLQDCGGLFIHELTGMTCRNRLYRVIRSGIRSNQLPPLAFAELDELLTDQGDLAFRMISVFDREFRFAVIPSIRFRGTPSEPVKERHMTTSYLQMAHAQQILVEWSFRNHPRPLDRSKSLVDAAQTIKTVQTALSEGRYAADVLVKVSEEFARGIPPAYRWILFDPTVGISFPALLSACHKLKRIDNACGRVSLHKLFSMGAQILTAAYKTEAERAATLISVATARFTAEGNTGPLESLYSLVYAGFLKEIPTDPISGLPFRFDPGTQSVWLPGPERMTFEQANANRKNGAWIWPVR